MKYVRLQFALLPIIYRNRVASPKPAFGDLPRVLLQYEHRQPDSLRWRKCRWTVLGDLSTAIRQEYLFTQGPSPRHNIGLATSRDDFLRPLRNNACSNVSE